MERKRVKFGEEAADLSDEMLGCTGVLWLRREA
ncbi:rCG41897 [Rattus norvegicus]|uniref:RCG41897 n=1 Tax=Rattus norvegicus TaxID=10116 RepID=A6KKS3_RAT|nr:rCG41897 [Rattus norvegicus]